MPKTKFLLPLIIFLISSKICLGLGPSIEKHFIGDYKTLPTPRTEWLKKRVRAQVDLVGHNLFKVGFGINWYPGVTNIIGGGEGSVNRKGRLVFYFRDNWGNQGYGILKKIPPKSYTPNLYLLTLKVTHSVNQRATEQYRDYEIQQIDDPLEE
ncbi:MAG: hypothetical protein K1X66_04780 [Verrucomicrobiae bacterium]|nr:hypothetical protein [Verrucomicrobiae bacterium]